MFFNKTNEIRSKIISSFEKGSYGGKIGIEGEEREWGGKTYKKEGTKWILVASKKDKFTYGQSKFFPKETPDYLKKVLPDTFFDTLEAIPSIKYIKRKNHSSDYNPETDKITLNTKGSSYRVNEIFIHELGHKFHFEKEIITDEHIDEDFKQIFDSFKEEFDSMPEGLKAYFKKENIDKAKEVLVKKYSPSMKSIKNKFGSVADVVCSITKGEAGYGHTKSYIKDKNNSYMELFAHGHEHYWLGNPFLNIFFPKSSNKIINYFKDIFENKY